MAEHPARGPSLRLIEHDSQIAVRCDSHSNESARVIEAIRTRWSNLDIVEAPLDALHPPDDFDDNDGWPVGPPPIHEFYEALGLPFEDDSDEVADADQYMVVDGVRTLIPTDAEVAAQGADARARGLLTLREAIARWNLENPGGNPIGIDDLDADDRANLDIRAHYPRGGPEGVPCEVYADAAHALLPTATHEEVIAAAQVRLAQARATQKRNESPAIPPRFRLTKETLYASREIKTKDGSRVEESQVCSRLEVAALTRDANSGEWGRLLQFDDPDGVGHEWAMPMSLLAAGGDEYRAALLEQGLRIYPGLNAKNDLHEYLAECRPAARGRAVTRMGWHGGVFVLPYATFGPLSNGERVLFQSASLVSHAFHVCGSLGDWQREIGMRCSGNSRLTFAVSAGFASPLLYLLGDESGGFHFVGPSSLGKTTALRGGGSVWGGSKEPMGFLRQWRATLNGLEGVAASHCHSLLPLDELSQVDAREAKGEAQNGHGKRALPLFEGKRAAPVTLEALVAGSSAETLLVCAPSVEKAVGLVGRFGGLRRVELELEDYTGIDAALEEGLRGRDVVRAGATTRAQAEVLLAVDAGFEVTVDLTKETAAWVLSLPAVPGRLALRQPNYERLTEASANDVDLRDFFARFPHEVPVDNVPACILGRPPRAAARVLDTTMMTPEGRLEIFRYTRRYILEGYRTKSLRCTECVHFEECTGMHINYVRAHGYGVMQAVVG